MQKQNQVLVDSFESEISALGFELVGVEMLSNGNTTPCEFISIKMRVLLLMIVFW